MTYRFAQVVFFVYYHLFYRLKISGKENIPDTGPVILCSNHISLNDPLLLGSSIKRPVHFIAKSELFKNPFFSFILRKINAIQVKRGTTDMSAFKSAMEVLDKGSVLGIFAQGGRVREEEAKDAKAGVALFALRSNAAVIPVKISGYKLFRRVTLTIGEPVNIGAFQGKKIKSDMLKELTDIIMAKVSSL